MLLGLGGGGCVLLCLRDHVLAGLSPTRRVHSVTPYLLLDVAGELGLDTGAAAAVRPYVLLQHLLLQSDLFLSVVVALGEHLGRLVLGGVPAHDHAVVETFLACLGWTGHLLRLHYNMVLIVADQGRM